MQSAIATMRRLERTQLMRCKAGLTLSDCLSLKVAAIARPFNFVSLRRHCAHLVHRAKSLIQAS